MSRLRRLRGLLLALIAVLVIVVAAVLSSRDNRREAASATLTSPLSAPADVAETLGTSSRSTSVAVLLWMALGSLLALGVAALILRRSRRDTQ